MRMALALRRRLRTNLLGLATAALAGTALFLFAYVLPTHLGAMGRTFAERRASDVAAVMASAIAPALELEDRERIAELLQGFSRSSEVTYAWVRRDDGSLIAFWPHDRGLDLGLRPRGAPMVVQHLGALHAVAEVQGRSGPGGRLGIGFSLAELERQERRNVFLVASGGGALFALGLVVALFTRSVGRRRRSAEEALARTESSFRTLIERTPEPMCIYRGRAFVYVNPALVRYLGYDSAGELLAQPPIEVVHPNDRRLLDQTLRGLLTSDQPVGPVEVRLLRKNRAVVAVELVGLSLEVDGQRSQVVLARDLTERQQLTARMMQMDRLAAVGTLAAGVAHEINNPLSFVIGNVDWMEGKVEEADQRMRSAAQALEAREFSRAGEDLGEASVRLARFRQVLDETRAGAERVRVIVRDLKTLSRSEDDKRGAVSVEAVIESVLQMAWNEIRHRAQLIKEYEPVPKAMGNEGRLGQLFLNLLINAAQAIPEGHADENRITVRTELFENRVCVSIADTGSGMAPDVIERIFDPFFTTKPQGQGTGLGLSICQSIAQSMGGEIRVESAPGRGSLFRVLLPPATTPDTPARTTPGAVPRGKRGRVLVVDDEPLVGRALRRSLEEEHEVVLVTSAREALLRLNAGEQFDAILCDIMMPEMTGYELYDQLLGSARDQARRMIFVTGGAFTPKARDFLDRVENKRVEKPFDVDRLKTLVRKMVR